MDLQGVKVDQGNTIFFRENEKMMILQEKLGVKVSVLFPKTTDNKINEICKRIERPKSNLIRYIVSDWVEKVIEKG